MARVSIRELFRFRTSFLNPSRPNFSSSSPYTSSSSDFNFDNPKHFLSPQTLKLFETCHNLKQLLQIQSHLITSGLFRNPSLACRVVKHSANFSDLNYTVLIFESIKYPDSFCVNTVIKAYFCSHVPNQAMVFYFENLKNGFEPNSFTFPPLISSCSKNECSKQGQKCHGQVIKNGVDSVLHVQNSLIHFYACYGLINIANKIFVKMPVRDMVSWNSIIDGFAKLGYLERAHQLFDEMPFKNLVSWNIMIGGYLNDGNPGCGLKLFRKMVKKGLRGSDTTIAMVLSACGRSARLKEGKSVHGSFIRTLMKASLVIDTALIDMYSRCRRVDIAHIVFRRMRVRNLVSWNAMILGHCIHGNPEDGLNLYEEMVDWTNSEDGDTNFDRNVKRDGGAAIIPDGITFIGVLCACARAGLLLEGRNYLTEMIDVFRIKPNFAHYWCMANLFASIGEMQKAEEILRNVPIDEDMSPESSFCAGLLGSCRFQGKFILGEQIAKALIESEPHNFSCYALLLNIYAMSGQWEDVAKLKETMKERGVRKLPGFNLVDLKEIVHSFKLGDKWQENIPELKMAMGVSAANLVD